MASTRPTAVIPPKVRIGVNADASSTLKPITITRQVAIIDGPVWPSADASASGPAAGPGEILVDEETRVVDGDAQGNPHDEHGGHVDRPARGSEYRRNDRDRQYIDEHGAGRQGPVAQRQEERHEARRPP